MMLIALALSLAAAQTAAPAAPPSTEQAAERWVHARSGISIPRRIGDLELSEERDTSGQGVDTIVQLGRGDEPVTLYIYRAAVPNAALWMERSWSAIAMRMAGADQAAPARAAVVDGTPAGFVRTTALTGGGFTATGLAIVRSGPWLVKVRATSSTRDEAAVAATIDRVVAALSLPTTASAAPPPPACETPAKLRGRIVTDELAALVADAAVPAVVAMATVRGIGGPAEGPAGWCRDPAAAPTQFATVLRNTAPDGGGWAALLGDAHMGLLTLRHPDHDGDARWGLYAGNASSVRLVAIYTAPPAFDTALQAAGPVLTGQAPGLLEVGDSTASPPTAQPST